MHYPRIEALNPWYRPTMGKGHTLGENAPARTSARNTEPLGNAEEEGQASERNCASSGTNCIGACRPANERSERNANEMKEAGCKHEASGEGKWIGRSGQFRAVRVPIENRKECNDAARNPEWGLGLKSDEKTQNNSRGGNTGFNGRNRHSQNAERPSECHHERENDR